MKTLQVRLLLGASIAALTGATPALAQQSPAEAPAQTTAEPSADEDIVVTGVRASLGTAQAIKQNSNQIVDSISAQDIGKLPDVNTTEALQRITGVQIQRRYGEGATDFDHRTSPAIAVRGLTQTQNLLDGRAVYSASGGRAFDLEGIPPELLSGVDVYKNAPAEIIEGGVGGAVNLRTRKPFDASGQVISMTARGNYYDRVDKFGGSISGLYSNRYDTGIGEIGVLLNAVYSKSQYRQDGLLAGPFGNARPGTIAGAPANAKIPYGFEVYDDSGDRKRLGVAAAVQWQANEDVLVTAQYQGTKYWFNRTGAYYYDTNNISDAFVNGTQTVYAARALPGAPFTFNDEGYATSGTIAPQTFETGRFDQELWSASQNYTFNVGWQATERAKINFDVQYLKSYYNADRNGHVLSLFTRAGQTVLNTPNSTGVLFDLRGKYPRWNVTNPSLLNTPANYTTPFIADSLQRNDADTLALAYDLEYDVEGSFLQKLRGGARFADNGIDLRGTWNGLCVTALGPDASCSAPAGTPLIPLSRNPQLSMPGPSRNWFDGQSVTGGLLYPAFPSGNGVWEQTKALYSLFGARTKDAFTPGDLNRQTEKTYTVWAVADYAFDAGGIRIDGGAGIRLIKTDTTSDGAAFATVVTNGVSSVVTTPFSASNSYTKALPSVNLRARLTDQLQLRFAYSKGLARANFDQLSTNLTLNNPNQLDTQGRASASAGNPRLNPITSNNFDVTAEWYFARAGSLTGGLFYKKVDGFLAPGFYEQTYQGRRYLVSTQVNAGNGTVKGAEIAYQQFFDFLPGLLSGFGVQANYTYVDSSVSNPTGVANSNLPPELPLEKLSKHSYNLIGLYEKGPVTARVAWSWRSSYLDTTIGSGANGFAQYAKPYASLDASLSVNLNEHLAVSADVVNLNNRMNTTYIQTEAQPLQYQLNDRRFGLSLRATY